MAATDPGLALTPQNTVPGQLLPNTSNDLTGLTGNPLTPDTGLTGFTGSPLSTLQTEVPGAGSTTGGSPDLSVPNASDLGMTTQTQVPGPGPTTPAGSTNPRLV